MVSGEGGDNETMDLAAILAEVLDVLEETEVIAMEIAATTTVIGGDDESTIDYVIPDRMVVTMEPREEVSLTLFYHETVSPIFTSGRPIARRGTWFT